MAEYKFTSFVDGKFDGKVPLKDITGMTDEEIKVLLNIGGLYYTQGKLDEARVIFQGLAAADPDNELVHSSMGALLTRMGENKDALESLNKALKLDPKDIAAYVNRGEVLFKMGKAEESAKDFKKALELDPNRKNPAANRARLILAGLAYIAKKAKEARK